MKEYHQIFLNKAIKVWLYNGDWDDVVPVRNNLDNLELLHAEKLDDWKPWFYGNDQIHAGFYRRYDNAKELAFITFKGGSHMVPRSKPKEAYQMFYNFIKNRPISNAVNGEDGGNH
jgi:carboxypeptidase C (cathepsin A)